MGAFDCPNPEHAFVLRAKVMGHKFVFVGRDDISRALKGDFSSALYENVTCLYRSSDYTARVLCHVPVPWNDEQRREFRRLLDQAAECTNFFPIKLKLTYNTFFTIDDVQYTFTRVKRAFGRTWSQTLSQLRLQFEDYRVYAAGCDASRLLHAHQLLTTHLRGAGVGDLFRAD